MTFDCEIKNAGMFAAVFVFIAACLAVIGLSYVSESHVETLENECAALEREHDVLSAEINNLMTKKRLMSSALDELKGYGHASLNRLDFYAALREIANDSAVEIVSMRWNGEPSERKGNDSITLALRGDYYGVARMMAACRNLPAPVRAAGLTVRSSQSGEVDAEVTLEAVLAER